MLRDWYGSNRQHQPRCNYLIMIIIIGAHAHAWPRNHDVGRSKFVMATFLSLAVRLANLQLRSVLGACILLHHRAVNSELCSLLVSEYMTRES